MTTCLNLYTTPVPRPEHLNVNPPNNIDQNTWFQECICSGVNPHTGQNLTLEQWYEQISQPFFDGNRDCAQVYQDIIHTNNGLYVFNPANYQRVTQDMTYSLSKYFNLTTEGHNLVLPGNPTWLQMQHTLVSLCVDNPGVCSTAQTTLCTGCDRPEISNNPDLLSLCGCFVPPLDPEIYTRVIPVECDPLCNQLITAKLADPTTGDVDVCNDTICVLDNISITATKSSVSGINISQVCPNCTAEVGCTCIVDISVTNMAASLGLDNPVTFTSYCPSEFATCLSINSTQQTSTVVPCDDFFASAPVVYDSSIPPTIWIIILIVVIIVLLALAALVFADKNTTLITPTKVSPTNIYPQPPISTNL